MNRMTKGILIFAGLLSCGALALKLSVLDVHRFADERPPLEVASQPLAKPLPIVEKSAASVVSAPREKSATTNWNESFHHAPNLFPLVKEASPRRDFDRCAQLAKDDPFSDLPARAGGYRNAAFWAAMALADGDPLAQVHQAVIDVENASYASASNRAASMEEAQNLLSYVAKSQDPDALHVAGQMLMDGWYSSDPLRGVAISLAACDLGYDCSANNPGNSFAVCRESGACPTDADYAYYVQQSLGPERFGTAYSEAQAFKDLLARGDWNGIAIYIALKESPSRN